MTQVTNIFQILSVAQVTLISNVQEEQEQQEQQEQQFLSASNYVVALLHLYIVVGDRKFLKIRYFCRQNRII